MKKLTLFLFVLAIGLTSCDKTVFKVKVNMENTADSTTVYLKKFDNDKFVVIDSSIILNGTTTFTVPNGNPQNVYQILQKGKYNPINFFADNKDVSVNQTIQNEGNVEIIASETQTRFDNFKKQSEVYNEKIQELYPFMEKAYANNDNMLMDSLNNVAENIMKEYSEFYHDYTMEHSDDFLTHYLLNENKYNLSLDELKEFMAAFGTENPSIYIDPLNQYIAKLEHVEIGHLCPDFTLPTINDGENATASKLIQGKKYVLIDFWASWCGPCRGENPFVVAAYNAYKEKGFDVIGVSVDKNIDKWKKAVTEDSLSWTQLNDADGSVSNTYAVYGIPSNFLVDSTGTIIAKNLRGDDLKNKLEELFQ